jgi:hypothetical protein
MDISHCERQQRHHLLEMIKWIIKYAYVCGNWCDTWRAKDIC